MNTQEYVEFKKLFWKWFDTLPRHEKERFWHFKEDMAETFFYFKHYNK